jgi:hypothetical protein
LGALKTFRITTLWLRSLPAKYIPPNRDHQKTVLIRAASKKRVAELLGVTPARLSQYGFYEQEHMTKFAVKPETIYYHVGQGLSGHSNAWIEMGALEECPLTLSQADVSKDALNLHYEILDVDGRKESDLPARIASAGDWYDLKYVPLAEVADAGIEAEERKISEFAAMTTPMPPIVIGEGRDIVDGKYRVLAARKRGDAGVLAYVARPR